MEEIKGLDCLTNAIQIYNDVSIHRILVEIQII